MVWNPPMTLLLPFPTTHPHAITLLGVYLNSIQRITFTVHVHSNTWDGIRPVIHYSTTNNTDYVPNQSNHNLTCTDFES